MLIFSCRFVCSKMLIEMKKIFETNRWVLREFVMEDDNKILEILGNGGKTHLIQYPLDINYARHFLNRWLTSYKDNVFGLWVIIEQETGDLIG